jgi:OTU domain-containing protein 5
MKEDGNCLFRAISDQVYGDPDMHEEVRERCMDYLLAERNHFSQFVTQDFDHYIMRKRHDKTFGNNLEMQALAEMYNRPIEVYRDSAHPMKIFHEGYTEASDSTPLRLSYHRGNHYNSVVNPNVHSVGEGLGIPLPRPAAHSPRDEIAEEFEKVALRESEQDDLEAAMLESILRASRETWERTQIQAQLEQMSVSESRQDYYRSFCFAGGNSAQSHGGSSGSDRCEAGANRARTPSGRALS